MNEFIEQFLLESRELVEQATAALLALEKTPRDKGHLDSAFRAFHTLKGGAAIVDFTAMAQAVHAAEDGLSAARSGARGMTTPLIGDCLTCLDQVVTWLDIIESTGEMPKDADAQARAVVARLTGSARAQSMAALQVRGSAEEDWASNFLQKHPAFRGQAKTGIRYKPRPDCFYQGVDPIALIAALPGLLSIDVQPASPWPPLDALDPFVCNLVVTALTKSASGEVIAALGPAVDECEVRSLAAGKESNAESFFSPQAREVLEAQIALMSETAPQGSAGRMASGGVVAANVLRNASRTSDADHVLRAMEVSLATNDPRALREAIEDVMSGMSSKAAAASLSIEPDRQARTLRIDAARIDALVNLTGELSVARNSIGHATKLIEQEAPELGSILKDRYAVLHRLVGELQHAVLGMRVLPLAHVFQRFPRLVREIAADLGKSATLVIEGGDTEADKAIVEMLFEPLLHVLRNAIDHGIEEASTRAALHKPPTAIIRLRAQREGEHVIVEVSDDGRGIDVGRIRRLARERNLLSEEALSAMSDEEVINIIFEPGFSTSADVTGLSGRGVGMDAVRSAVERLAGHVSVESRAGHGTTLRFILPFSVMMTRVMLVGAGEQMFGIPLDAVVETLRIGADRIAPIGAAQVVVIRDRTIPVVSLAEALDVTRTGRQEAEVTLVVTKIEGHYGALRVDRVGERMEVMMKPLDGLLTGMRGLAGSTLLGDGSVLLILDVDTLIQ